MLLWACSGCAVKAPAQGLDVRASYGRCGRPGPVALVPLDEHKHLGHPDNAAGLMRNMDGLAQGLALRDAALDCYEQQTAKESAGNE